MKNKLGSVTLKPLTKVSFILICLFVGYFSQTKAQTNIAPQAVFSAAPGCSTGACTTFNDLNFGTCGTQQVWISGGNGLPPGQVYIEAQWTTPQSFNEFIIHHAQDATRHLCGGLIQVWNGATWINHHTFSNLPLACINSVVFPVVKTNRVRITAFVHCGSQLSNANFREIEIISAISAVKNDVTIAKLETPSNPLCGTTSPAVNVTLENPGLANLDSCMLYWQVTRPGQPNPFPLRTIKWKGSIPPGGAQSNISLGNFQGGFFPGDSIIVYSELPNGEFDSLPDGDTIRQIFISGSPGGTYTIGNNNADFGSFSQAVAFLDSLGGICDSLVFLVQDSVYNEQIEINQILGTRANRQVIFKSISGNPGAARLTFATTIPDTNFTLNLRNASHFKFVGIGISNTGGTATSGNATAIALENSDNIIFKNCNFSTTSVTVGTPNFAVVRSASSKNLNFENCAFSNGSIGLSLFEGDGSLIQNCRFNNQYEHALQIGGGTNITIQKNTITSNSSKAPSTQIPTSLISIGGVTGGLKVLGNTIYSDVEYPNAAILISDCNATANAKALIANNFIGLAAAYSSEDFYGVLIIESSFTNIYNNNISIEGNSSNSAAIKFDMGGNNILANNNLINYGNGKALVVVGQFSLLSSENNNLYSLGSNLTSFAGVNSNNLAAWQGFGFDQNSVSLDPLFYNKPNDLHICNGFLDGAGISLAEVSYDIDGDLRDPSTPDIGADEITPVNFFDLGSDIGICYGDSVQLIGGLNTGDVNAWSTGDTATSIWVNQTSTIVLSLFNKCGAKQDTINITEEIEVELPADTNLCPKESIILQTNLNTGNFLWSNGSTAKNIVADKSGTYSVTVTDANGCQSSDQITVSQSEHANIIGRNFVCEGQSEFLEALPTNANYTWSTGASNAIIGVFTPGTYWVEVNDLGCITRDTVEMLFKPQPIVDYTSAISFNTFTVLTNNSKGDTHEWDFGDGNKSNLVKPNHIYAANGSYTVTYRVYNNCDTVMETEEVRITVGLNEHTNKQSLKVYPNPATNKIQISNFGKLGIYDIYLMDIQGRLVYQTKHNNTGTEIAEIFVEDLKPGIYMLKVTNSEFIETLQINISK